MTHRQIVSPYDPHIRNALPVFIERFHGSDHIIKMLPGKAAPVDREPYDVCDFRLLFRRLEVVLHRIVSKLRDPDAVPPDQFQGEAFAGESIMSPFSVEEGVHVDLVVNLEYGYDIPETASEIQEKVQSAIENMTGMNVTGVNIRVVGIAAESDD